MKANGGDNGDEETPAPSPSAPRGLAGVHAEWAAAPTPRAKDYLETALYNAGVDDPHAPDAAKKKADPALLARRVASAYVDLHGANLDMAFTLAGLRADLGLVEGALEMLERIELFDPEYEGLAELRAKLRRS